MAHTHGETQMHQIKSMIKNDQGYVSYNSKQMENKQPGNNPIVNRKQNG